MQISREKFTILRNQRATEFFKIRRRQKNPPHSCCVLIRFSKSNIGYIEFIRWVCVCDGTIYVYYEGRFFWKYLIMLASVYIFYYGKINIIQ